MKLFKRVLCVFLCLAIVTALPFTAHGQRDPWDCSCGTKGNTGNFCRECGKPAPADESETTSEPENESAWTVLYKVYYKDEAGTILNTETLYLSGSGMITYTLPADEAMVPAGYELSGEEYAVVTVENGIANPVKVTFVCRNTATPTPSSAPTPTPLVLKPASGLSVQKTDQTSVTLSWNSVANAQGYWVMVKEKKSSDWRVGTDTAGTSAQITKLNAGTEYQFKVIAMNGDAKSESGIITAMTAATSTSAPVKAGQYVKFGHYPQTAAGNDNTPIEWLVLAVQGNRALLLSRYELDAKPYNTLKTGVTWETCTLRTWLNGEFLNKAFTAEEKTGIQTRAIAYCEIIK